jgi:hypothetical protein
MGTKVVHDTQHPSDGIAREMKMAKIMKRKLSWKASRSPQTTGYKLYWARQGDLGYDSASEYLGAVTEVVIPNGLSAFAPATGPFEFGIVAVDDSGNESDMTTVTVPFHFIAPDAPVKMQIDKVGAEEVKAEKKDKILALKHRKKAPEQRKPAAAKTKAAPVVVTADDDSLEFFETDRTDAGAMFTKEDLEIFEADLKL